ncbi:acetate--CoA ligase family protein, partial [Chloroflexota bacterium]
MDSIFHPRSVAVVGISLSRPDSLGNDLLYSLRKFGFKGPIYLVNPSGGEIMGLKVYPSLNDIPGEVDFVISTTPARVAPKLVEECACKGVKAIHFFTAGFSETGETEGVKLEAEAARIARNTGVRIVGPNCMGIYCPESGLTFMSHFPRESGPVGLISQSGANAVDIINHTMWRGVRFSKVISYGNGSDLNESDFLEYLYTDPSTKIIALYVEGIKDGKRFRQALDKAMKEKVVILLKAGVTKAGSRATQSHTASLAGNDAAWDALCKQSGAIRVHSLQGMADMLVTALFMPRFMKRNAALIGVGGGLSVMLTDEFESRGIRVPPLPNKIRDRIREFARAEGNMLSNPIDFSQALYEPEKLTKTISIVADWEGIDFIVGFLTLGYYSITSSDKKKQVWLNVADRLLEGAKLISKPIAIMLESSIL